MNKDRLDLFRSLFIGREDVHAIGTDTGIKAVRSPLADKVLAAHLDGAYRVGSYPIFNQHWTLRLVFDVDRHDYEGRALVRIIVRRLRRLGVSPYIERSRNKGFHICVLFNKPLRAARARQFAEIVLRGLDCPIEVFPKQITVEEGKFGNAISFRSSAMISITATPCSSSTTSDRFPISGPSSER